MAKIIKKTTAYDEETGEVYYQQAYKTFNGWSDDGYKYRYRTAAIKFYPDNLPKLQPNVMKIFFLICFLMNEDNLLVEKRKAKNKYSGPELIRFSVDDIWERLPYRVSQYSFKKAWQEITPKYVRQIKFQGKRVWAVNPAFANRTNYMPAWLWNEFKKDLEPWIGAQNIARYENLYLNEGL